MLAGLNSATACSYPANVHCRDVAAHGLSKTFPRRRSATAGDKGTATDRARRRRRPFVGRGHAGSRGLPAGRSVKSPGRGKGGQVDRGGDECGGHWPVVSPTALRDMCLSVCVLGKQTDRRKLSLMHYCCSLILIYVANASLARGCTHCAFPQFSFTLTRTYNAIT